jgi:hypothetical protein
VDKMKKTRRKFTAAFKAQAGWQTSNQIILNGAYKQEQNG